MHWERGVGSGCKLGGGWKNLLIPILLWSFVDMYVHDEEMKSICNSDIESFHSGHASAE